MRERYDRGYQGGPNRYDRDFGRNAAAYGGTAPTAPFGGWYGMGYPTSPFLMGAPAYPLGFGWGAPPYPPFRGGYDRDFRRPPEQSPTYGRGGDRAVREYLRERGYDAGYTLRPHPSGPGRAGPPPGRRGYDRGFRR